MTSRERVLAALAHQPTDRVPFSLGMGVNPPVVAALAQDMGFADLCRAYAYLQSLSDIRHVGPRYVGPKDRHCTDENGVSTDIWGVKRAPVHYSSQGAYAEICEYPLANVETVAELDSFLWPSVDWFDFSVLPQQIKDHNTPKADAPFARKGPAYAIMMGNGNIFETSWYMRGFETMLADLLVEPELAEAIMTRVTDFYIAYFTAALTVTNGPQNNDSQNPDPSIDIIFTADDIGSQEGLLCSLDLWERMLKPHHKRMNAVLHRFGVKIMYHSDGAVMEALDGLIDMGIDILEALQFDAKGMSPERMKARYGDRLCFHGGVSVQSTLPFGTVADVEAEVAARIAVLGENGGYILAPSHAVQAGTPVENLKAFLRFGE